MKKAIILTFSRIDNRGANLQAYALKKTLEEYGMDVYFLDFQLKYTYNSLNARIFQTVANINASFFRRKMNFKFTRNFKDKSDLERNCPCADVYIVGSDQVWNPSLTKSVGGTTYFFDFLPDGQKRVSYAASFGESWKPTSDDNLICQLLSKFSFIGVRETNGLGILRDKFGINDAKLVLDPSLLLSPQDIYSIVGDVKEKKRIYSYLLYRTEDICKMTDLISRTLSLPKFGTDDRSLFRKIKKMHGVRTWLRNIASSSVIVTNSFHCMSVALILNKKVIVLPPHPGREQRMISLLKLLGCEGAFFSGLDDLKNRLNQVTNWELPYNSINENLNLLKNESKKYILNEIAK